MNNQGFKYTLQADRVSKSKVESNQMAMSRVMLKSDVDDRERAINSNISNRFKSSMIAGGLIAVMVISGTSTTNIIELNPLRKGIEIKGQDILELKAHKPIDGTYARSSKYEKGDAMKKVIPVTLKVTKVAKQTPRIVGNDLYEENVYDNDRPANKGVKTITLKVTKVENSVKHA